MNHKCGKRCKEGSAKILLLSNGEERLMTVKMNCDIVFKKTKKRSIVEISENINKSDGKISYWVKNDLLVDIDFIVSDDNTVIVTYLKKTFDRYFDCILQDLSPIDSNEPSSI